MKEIGVAIVGTGFMGWVHAEALRRVGVTITGVLASSPAKSQTAAEELSLDFKASPTFPTFADGHREIVLCDAILESHRDGRWVTIQ